MVGAWRRLWLCCRDLNTLRKRVDGIDDTLGIVLRLCTTLKLDIGDGWLCFDFDESIDAVAAKRANIIGRKFVGFDFETADFAAPNRFLARCRGGLWFDVFLVVVVGERSAPRSDFCAYDVG